MIYFYIFISVIGSRIFYKQDMECSDFIIGLSFLVYSLGNIIEYLK